MVGFLVLIVQCDVAFIAFTWGHVKHVARTLCNTRKLTDDLLGWKKPSFRKPNLNKVRSNLAAKCGPIFAFTFERSPNPTRSARWRWRPVKVMMSPKRFPSALSQMIDVFVAVANRRSASRSSVNASVKARFFCASCWSSGERKVLLTESMIFETSGVTR